MGGYVAFAFLRNYPARVRGLVLADTRPQPDAPEGKAGRFASALTAQKEGAGAIANAMLGRLLSQKSTDEKPDLVKHVREMIESTPVQGIAGDLMSMAERPDSVPMLAWNPRAHPRHRRRARPPHPARRLELHGQHHPRRKDQVIPGAAHLSNMEDPATFNRAVGDFLATIPA